MRKWNTILSLFITVIILVYFFYQYSHSSAPFGSSPTPTRVVLGTQQANPQASCHEHNGLPDPTCTPGSTNPAVTQDNIMSTICRSGYTKTIRPPVSYTQSLKKQQITEYGYTDTSLHDYEEDHLIPLEVGGNPTDPKNLWPEPGASPNPKDDIENVCNQKVCSGQMSLQEAQQEIATDWETACQ